MTVAFGTTLRTGSEALGNVAGTLAQRLGESLRLVHVAEDPRAPIVLGTDEEHILGSIRADLDREAKRIQSITGATVHPHLAAGSTAHALVTIAEWELATVLMVGAGTKPRRNPLGSVVERVARKSRVPVLTVRHPERFSNWLLGQQPLRVLVGSDLGLAAKAARAFAASLGGAGDCDVEVMLVASPEETHQRLGLNPPDDPHALLWEAEASLTRELSRSKPDEERTATLRVVPGRGSADAHLVARADQGDFDLIVVGQRRHSIVEQVWYGSVAQGVLHAASTSVASVPRPLGDAQPFLQAPRVVVVATDLGETANQGLAQALAVVANGGVVHLAHVVEPSPAVGESNARRIRDRVWDQLSRMIPEESPERPVTLERHVLEGGAAAQLKALSERVGADLVVLGRSKRHSISRALLGSVARDVIEMSRVPVLVVPAQEL